MHINNPPIMPAQELYQRIRDGLHLYSFKGYILSDVVLAELGFVNRAELGFVNRAQPERIEDVLNKRLRSIEKQFKVISYPFRPDRTIIVCCEVDKRLHNTDVTPDDIEATII